MEHLDEKILGIKNQFKKLENKDIYTDAYIGGKKVEFEDVTFFGEKMSMRIPKEFTDMPLEFAKLKYPSEQRPKVIKMNEDGSINITLNIIDEQLKNEDVKETRDGLKVIMERMNPASFFYDSKLEELEDITIGYFDYKSNAIDCDLYNIMFIAPIAGKVLLGSFNCQHKDREEWKAVALQMIMSIKDLTKKKGV